MFKILFEKNYSTHNVAILCMNTSTCMRRNTAVTFLGHTATKFLLKYKLFNFIRSSEKYGDLDVDIEYGKKESRSDDAKVISFKKFLDTYKDDDIYMVQDVKPSMKGGISHLFPE